MLASPVAAGHSLIKCVDRDVALENLAKKYSEAPVAGGITSTGGLVELLTTRDGSTWTIIVTTPQGVSCMVAAGQDWHTRKQPSPKPEGMAL